MQIGGHVSIAGGFDKSIDRAAGIGANILQTFASSPRSLKVKDFDGDIIEKYLIKKDQFKMGLHFFHGVYLVNLAHETKDYTQASIDSLGFYQNLAGTIKGAGTIFHIGSHKGRGFEQVRDQVVGAVEKVLIDTPDDVKLYLENAAGHKGVIGADLTELRYIYDSISSDELRQKLKVCYDTQHGFAAGFDIRDESALKESLKTIDNQLGLELLGVIHLNDSLTPFDSHKDRHANIGEGEIGEKGFRALINHPKIKSLPFLMEVPGENKSGPRKEDVEKLISFTS